MLSRDASIQTDVWAPNTAKAPEMPVISTEMIKGLVWQRPVSVFLIKKLSEPQSNISAQSFHRNYTDVIILKDLS